MEHPALTKSSKSLKRLTVTEWSGVFFFIGIFIILTFLTHSRNSFMREEDVERSHFLYNQVVEVYVEGAIKNPGLYEMKKGDTLEDLFHQVELTDGADTRKLKLKSKLRHGQVVKVPARQIIRIELEGAVVKKGEYAIPKGTKRNQLATYVEFMPEADLSNLQGAKPLKNGEKIVIPSYLYK